MKYFTNGINEKRFNDKDIIPNGWFPGRLKSTVTTLNKIWYNNGKNEIFLDYDSIIPDGYVKGRLKRSEESINKHKNTMELKKYSFYNNGIKEIQVSINDIVPNGFVKGRLPMSDDQKLKLRESHIGKHHTEITKKKISEHSNNNREKAKQTCLEKYGTEYYNNRDKELETKRKNNSFNTSKPEIIYYKNLCETYGKNNILRNYKSNEYPFRCDYYIKSLNKYIELNLHWTHGGRPFDPDNEECKKQLEIWKEKAKTSQFYQNAIQTWTVRDVEKQRIAKENNLNYEILYKI